MKRKRISTYISEWIVMSSLWLLLAPACVMAQETANVPLTDEEWKETPLYQGIYIGADIYGLASKAFGSDITSAEVSAEVNLKNRFYPIVEIGYGSTNTTNDETDIHYKTSAPYFRVGMSYNVFYKKPYLPGEFLVGLRYGFTSFSYDVAAPSMTDPTWGAPTIPFSYSGEKSNASWLELSIGLKSNVYKNFYMGLALRYRSRISMKKNENSEPWYIPGYGKNKSTNIGVIYTLVYKLPF